MILSSVPDRADIERIANNLNKQISRPARIAQREVSVGTSIGIALYPDHGATPEELIRQADHAMYRVKHRGKNGFAFADRDSGDAIEAFDFSESHADK